MSPRRRISFRTGPAKQRGLPLVKSSVELAHNLGRDVVAEGVETNHQRVVLEELNGRYAQGYLFGRPAPVDEIPRTFNEVPPTS